VSDHGLDSVLYAPATKDKANAVLQKALSGENLCTHELRQYKGFLLSFLGKEYHKLGWVMQYHIGPMRNNSTRMFNRIGADTGFDSINDAPVAVDLSRLLDSMDITNQLPKTVLYCLNPSDNAVLASMLGNFQGGGIIGKMQFGSGWWFMDTKKGMINQMEDLASMGLLSRFVGMLTDSRSFLSFPRHEYFRRIMCNELAKLVENGEYPPDFHILEEIVKGICYNNIANYIQI
ncbi:MAG: glucuronate isomerase, partial [Spirochaetales bacterium]